MDPDRSEDGRFPVTRLSAVLALGDADEEARRRAAAAVIEAYFRPVYKLVRLRARRSREDAEDLTQAFFTTVLEKGYLAGYDPAKARFRTFLRTCLEGFLANAHRAARRQKRGGGAVIASLDFDGAEAEIARAVADPAEPPEAFFEREWRRALLGLSVAELRARWTRAGKAAAFAIFERYDLADDEARPTYTAIAAELGVSAAVVTNQLHAARRALRAIALEKLAELCANEAELREEARLLLGVEIGRP